MISVAERLKDLYLAKSQGLLTDEEYKEGKRQLICESPHRRGDDYGGEDAGRRAHDTIASGTEHGEDKTDLYPLPFPVKRGATTKAGIEQQEHYNTEMFMVFRANPKMPVSDRKREVARRWEMKRQIAQLREEVRSVVARARSLARSQERPKNPEASTMRATVGVRNTAPTIPRRSGAKASTAPAPAAFDEAETRSLLARLETLMAQVRSEHDMVLLTPRPILCAELVGPESARVYDKKPHLFSLLRTAEVVTVDSHRLADLTNHLGMLRYLQAKLRRCTAAPPEGHLRSPSPHALHTPPGPPSPSPVKNTSQVLLAWRKFSRAAAAELREEELRLVSEDTLESLLGHFGKHLTSTEKRWVKLQWQTFQLMSQSPLHTMTPPLPPHSTRSPRSPSLRAEDVGSWGSPSRLPTRAVPAEPLIDAGVGSAMTRPAREQMVLELERLRAMTERREELLEAESVVRHEYEEVLVATLQENMQLIAERNATDATLVEELVQQVQRECREDFEKQRVVLEERLERAVAESGEVRREMDEAYRRAQEEIAAVRASADLEAKRQVSQQFQREFEEVRHLRQVYELQLDQLRQQMVVCDEQNSRLNTELKSTYGERLIEDIKDKLKAEYLRENIAKEQEYRKEVDSLKRELEQQKIKSKLAADEEAKNKAELYKQCLKEVKEATFLASQRESLVAKLDEVEGRVSRLSASGPTLSPSPGKLTSPSPRRAAPPPEPYRQDVARCIISPSRLRSGT